MNSFKAVQRGLEYEVVRQEKILKAGGQVAMETRRWDEGKGITVEMRGKEEEHDYRYFPEPDLPSLLLEEAFLHEIRAAIPELPIPRYLRLIKEYRLSPYQAEIITSSKHLADFFEAALKYFPDPQQVSNWLLGDIMGLLNSLGKEINQTAFTPLHLGELLKLLSEGRLSGRLAKEVLEESFLSGKRPAEIVEEKGLMQISDKQRLLDLIHEVIKDNPGAIDDYKGGNKKAIAFLVGQVMKRTRGQANPQLLTELLKKELGE